MPRQSTRGKMKTGMDRAIKAVDKVLDHLQAVDILADGKHPVVKDNMSVAVTLAASFKQFLMQFKENI
jgi:hypothetical protein